MSNEIYFERVFLELLLQAKWLLFAFLCLIVVGGFIFLAEGLIVNGQDCPTHHPGLAIYTAFVTALTIGYGDMTPAGPIGMVAVVVLGIGGMVFVGVVVAACITALKYSVIKNDNG